MNAEMRAFAWQGVERALAQLQLAPGVSCAIAIMVEARIEESLPTIRSELSGAGIEVAAVEKKWWPFGRRWRIAAKAPARQITRSEVDSWLDGLERTLTRYDATVVGWVPLLPGA